MLECSGCFSEIFYADATVFWVFDIESIWWMLTLVVFSLLWWSWRTFRAAWRFACGSHNSIFMGPRKCTSGGDRYMRSRDRYTYRQKRHTAPVLTSDQESHHRTVLPAGHIHTVFGIDRLIYKPSDFKPHIFA